VSASVAVVATMAAQALALARELEAGFELHPDAKVVRSLPGLGTVLGARVMGEFGDEPGRYLTAQVSQELRRHIAHNSRLGHQEGCARPPRPQPPRRCDLSLGVRCPHGIAGRPGVLRPAPGRG